MAPNAKLKGGYTAPRNNMGLAPIGCDRPNCPGSIEANVLAHKLHLGQKPKCFECAKVKHTRYYKLPPGAERLFKFKPMGAPLHNATKPANATNDKQLQAQAARIADLERRLQATMPIKGPNVQDGVNANPFNKEDSLQLKALSKDLTKLEELDEDEQKLFFPNDGDFIKRVQELRDQKQQIWANNRAKLPIKAQWEKQRGFVNKCEAELKNIKDEQTALLLKFQELEDDIQSKTAVLVSKKVELAELAVKAAKEDAVEPERIDSTINAPLIAKEEVQLFNLFKTLLTKSNVHEVLQAQGATAEQIGSMHAMWEKVSQVVEHNKGTDPPPAFGSQPPEPLGAPPLTPAAPPDGNAINKPVDEDMDTEEHEMDAAWANHMDANAEISSLGKEDQEQRMRAFQLVHRALKQRKTDSSSA